MFNRHTGDVFKEVSKAGAAAEAAMPNDSLLSNSGARTVDLPMDGSSAGGSTVTPPPFAASTNGSNGSTGNGANGQARAPTGYGSTPPYPYEGARRQSRRSRPG